MIFTFDKEKRKYIDDEGNVVSESQVKQWLSDLLDALLLLFISRAKSFFSEEITFAEFFELTQADLDSLHRASAALAFGGFDQMQSDDHFNVEQMIFFQLAFFRNFATLLFYSSISEAQALARLALYVAAGYSTYENSRTIRERKAGMLIYKRILKPGNNCEECVEYAHLGWRLIGTLPAIGQNCSCHSNCRCHFIFSNDLSKL